MKDQISSSPSSSRCSSITSASSDGHFDIRHFPLPKPALSASEAQKQRESYQAYNSSMSSNTGSSWSSSAHGNHLVDLPGYDPNRIPSSVFSSKPGNSTDWSLASNESLFSIHDMNFNISTKEENGFSGQSEIPKIEETVSEIAEIKPDLLPPIKKQDEETVSEKKINGLVEIETGEDMIKEKEVVEDVKENKLDDLKSTHSHSPSISWLSETSNNSISSFKFPAMQKEDAPNKTPSMDIKRCVSYNGRTDYPQQPKSAQPQRKTSSKSKLLESQTKSPKGARHFKRNSCFACFHCPSKSSLFK